MFGAIYMVQATIPHIRPGGRIINISSISQKVGMIAVPIYSATKAALDSLAFTWAGEVRVFLAPLLFVSYVVAEDRISFPSSSVCRILMQFWHLVW